MVSEHLRALRDIVGRADATTRALPGDSAPRLISEAMAEVTPSVELEALASAVIRKCRRMTAIMELTFTGNGPDVEAARTDALAAIDVLREKLARRSGSPRRAN